MTPIDIRPTTWSDERFTAAYEMLLRPTFPRVELVDASQLLEDNADGLNRMWCAVDSAGRTIGVAVVDLYAEAQAALLSYLAVAPQARGTGIGSRLLDCVRTDDDVRRSRHLFAEVEDPRFARTDRWRGDPWRRLRFYARCGAEAVAIAYRQPPVRKGAADAGGMILCRLSDAAGHAPQGHQIPARDLRRFFACIGAAIPVPPGRDAVPLLPLEDLSAIPYSL